MKIVIDIPEHTFNHVHNGGDIGASLLIENAIKNGIPLPKGHGEQEPVLDKIKDKIEKERTFQRVMGEYDIATGLRKALEIIDKYNVESEDKE